MMRAIGTCADCGDSSPNSYGLCSCCVAARAVASAEAQGLPPLVDDAAVFDAVATLTKTATLERRAS